jgi:ParB family chromosome partitioning protein
MTNGEFKALGKGLSSLIPNKLSIDVDSTHGAQDTLIEVAIERVIPNANQPRKNFRDDEILELSKSIKAHGVIQPILLGKTDGENYQIIAGERRWRAAKLAGLKTISAIIKGFTDKENIEVSLIENIQREDLSPLEEAGIYEKLIGEHSYTQEKLAEKIGKSRSYVANLVRLLKLPEKFKKLLAEDKLSAGHARLLLNCKSPDDLVKIIQENNLSVREAESVVSGKKPLKPLDFNKELKDPDLILLEKKIEQKLKLKTKIAIGEKEGKITINFKTMDEFDYLVSVLCEDLKLKI